MVRRRQIALAQTWRQEAAVLPSPQFPLYIRRMNEHVAPPRLADDAANDTIVDQLRAALAILDEVVIEPDHPADLDLSLAQVSLEIALHKLVADHVERRKIRAV
jgi:hypothetical protein